MRSGMVPVDLMIYSLNSPSAPEHLARHAEIRWTIKSKDNETPVLVLFD
jgi:hypothetical protein